MNVSRRIEKLNQVLKEGVGGIIDRGLELPPNHLLTVTRVETSPDAHYADVFISILGPDPKRVMEILQKKIYTVQQELNRRIRRRPVPAIRYRLDKQEWQRERVERAFAKLKRGEKS